MDIDIIAGISTVTKLIAENSMLIVSGAVVIIIVAIFITIAVMLFKYVLEQAKNSNTQMTDLIASTIKENKDNLRRDRDERNKQIEQLTKQFQILGEKIEVMLEGVNNSFNGMYAMLDTIEVKINAEKELSEEEYLKQAIAYMEIGVYQIKDIFMAKVEKNHLVDQKFNNIGLAPDHLDGEIADTILRIYNEIKLRIDQLNFNNVDFKQKLEKKLKPFILDTIERSCLIFNIQEDTYQTTSLNTQLRLLANKSLTYLKSLTIPSLNCTP